MRNEEASYVWYGQQGYIEDFQQENALETINIIKINSMNHF